MIDIWHLKRVDWLSDLPPAASKRLRDSGVVLELGRGELVFEPSKRPRFVFILERGLIRIFRRGRQGRELTYGFVHDGEVFGELAAFSSKPRESFAETKRPSVVWKVPKAVFREVMTSSPDVVFEVARQVEGRFKRIESRVEDLVFRDVLSRVARVILELAEQFGEAVDGRLLVRFPTSQQDLAVLVGASRQSVSEALKSLQELGVLERQRGRTEVLDVSALERVAKGRGAS